MQAGQTSEDATRNAYRILAGKTLGKHEDMSREVNITWNLRTFSYTVNDGDGLNWLWSISSDGIRC
jgi:hypothetical protein